MISKPTFEDYVELKLFFLQNLHHNHIQYLLVAEL